MKTYLTQISIAIILFLSALPTLVEAQSDDYDEVNFDSLVNELSRPQTRSVYHARPSTLDDVEIYSGLGMITSALNIHQTYSHPIFKRKKVEDPNGSIQGDDGKTYREEVTSEIDKWESRERQLNPTNKGIQVSLGIDLFSHNWKAEGTLRNYDDQRIDSCNVSLKEFDLKLIYQDSLTNSLHLFGGGGIAARYLDIQDELYGLKYEYSTPSSIFFLGGSTRITRMMNLGVEFSRRAAMISDTADREAFDMTIRLDAHF